MDVFQYQRTMEIEGIGKMTSDFKWHDYYGITLGSQILIDLRYIASIAGLQVLYFMIFIARSARTSPLINN
jgi:hypothetical protein